MSDVLLDVHIVMRRSCRRTAGRSRSGAGGSSPSRGRRAGVEAWRGSGVPVGVCTTPTLPVEDVDAFARRLAAFRPDVLVCQDFHDAGGGFGADTGEGARRLLAEIGWTAADYRRFVERMRHDLTIYAAETGFFPPPPVEDASSMGR